MLPLLFLVFLTLNSRGQVLADGSFKSTSKFLCAGDLFCSEESQSSFFETELLVKILERRNFSDDQRQYYELKKLSLCNDVTYAGFLLSNATADWPVSCLWTCLKNRSFYACAPAPPSYDIKDYILRKKWSKMLTEFRTRINCSKDQIEAAKEVKELNICRGRCVNLGVSSLSLWILTVSLIFSTLLLIGRDDWFGWFFYYASFTTLWYIFIYMIWKPF
uniref:Uncharacterized protein n=1 Tax=Acrobeloides nanus TaxID=290746 RepID=A0A914DIA4_9BILA